MGGGVPGRSNLAWNFQLGDTGAGVGICVQANLLELDTLRPCHPTREEPGSRKVSDELQR